MLQRLRALVREPGREVRYPLGIGRLEVEDVEDPIRVVDLVARAIDRTRSRHQDHRALAAAAKATAGGKADEDLPASRIAQSDTDVEPSIRSHQRPGGHDGRPLVAARHHRRSRKESGQQPGHIGACVEHGCAAMVALHQPVQGD